MYEKRELRLEEQDNILEKEKDFEEKPLQIKKI